jgi:hypothetical protein
MKFNAVAAGFFTSQPSSGDISKFPQKMRQFISKSLAENKDFSQPYFIFQRVFSGLTGRFVFQMPGALKASTTSWFWCMVVEAKIANGSGPRRRPGWLPARANGLNRYRDSAHFEVSSQP